MFILTVDSLDSALKALGHHGYGDFFPEPPEMVSLRSPLTGIMPIGFFASFVRLTLMSFVGMQHWPCERAALAHKRLKWPVTSRPRRPFRGRLS